MCITTFIGSIDVQEMIEIVGNLYEMEGVCKVGVGEDEHGVKDLPPRIQLWKKLLQLSICWMLIPTES